MKAWFFISSATASGDSQWISCEESRRIVHRLRGRVDAIIIGRGTAEADDPQLTARPPGPRAATRIVVDSKCSLSPESKLAQTAHDVPVLVAVGPDMAPDKGERLRHAGCNVLLHAMLNRAEGGISRAP